MIMWFILHVHSALSEAVQVVFHDVFYTTNTDGQHCSMFLDRDGPILTNKRVCMMNVWLGDG
jgi:hypothetical protein